MKLSPEEVRFLINVLDKSPICLPKEVKYEKLKQKLQDYDNQLHR